MLKRLFGLAILVLIAARSFAQDSAATSASILDIGLRLQKGVGLYNENGISVAYSNKNLRPGRLYFGFTYITSRLGTAFNSNAIKQDNFLLSSAYAFRYKHRLKPFLRANVGYFMADYGNEIFDVLPHKSPMLSTDFGLSYQRNSPLKVQTSLGYNFITGDGVDGPGTLYPLYYQFTFSWDIFNRKR